MKKLFFSLVLGTIIAVCWVMIIHTLKWMAIRGNEFEGLLLQQQAGASASASALAANQPARLPPGGALLERLARAPDGASGQLALTLKKPRAFAALEQTAARVGQQRRQEPQMQSQPQFQAHLRPRARRPGTPLLPATEEEPLKSEASFNAPSSSRDQLDQLEPDEPEAAAPQPPLLQPQLDETAAAAEGEQQATPIASQLAERAASFVAPNALLYRAPFFTSWFVSTWNILFMPVFTLISSCCFRNEDNTTKKLLV